MKYSTGIGDLAGGLILLAAAGLPIQPLMAGDEGSRLTTNWWPLPAIDRLVAAWTGRWQADRFKARRWMRQARRWPMRQS